jgi:hypothetical protein
VVGPQSDAGTSTPAPNTGGAVTPTPPVNTTPPTGKGASSSSSSNAAGSSSGSATAPSLDFPPPKVDGVFEYGDKVVFRDYKGKMQAGVVVNISGNSAQIMLPGEDYPSYAAVKDLHHFKKPTQLQEPPSVDEWEAPFRKGDVIISKDLVDGNKVAIKITSAKGKDFYEGVTDSGELIKVSKKGAISHTEMSGVPLNSSKLWKAFDDYVKGNPSAPRGTVKLSVRDADAAALGYKKGETVTADLVIQQMKGKYNVTKDVLLDSKKLKKVLDKFSHTTLRLGSARGMGLEEVYCFDNTTDAQQFYSNLGKGAAGVCRTWANGRREIGVSVNSTKGILKVIDYSNKGKELESIRDKQIAFDHVGTLVHESIHTYHPPGFNANNKEHLAINEGMTEWLSHKKTRHFIKATGMEKAFGSYLDNPDVAALSTAYSSWVQCIDKLALLIENKGYNAEEVLTREHTKGYVKQWPLVSKILGKSSITIRDVMHKAANANSPMMVIRELNK